MLLRKPLAGTRFLCSSFLLVPAVFAYQRGCRGGSLMKMASLVGGKITANNCATVELWSDVSRGTRGSSQRFETRSASEIRLLVFLEDLCAAV